MRMTEEMFEKNYDNFDTQKTDLDRQFGNRQIPCLFF